MKKSLPYGPATIAVRIVLVISLLLSIPAQAQSIVGAWTLGGSTNWVFDANGRWAYSVTNDLVVSGSCTSSVISESGTYTVSGGSINLLFDNIVCNGSLDFPPISFGDGSYTVTESTLAIRLLNAYVGPIDFTFTRIGATSVPRTTSLPPPTVTQSVYAAPTGRIPAEAVQVSATGTYGEANLQVTLDILRGLQASAAAGFAAAGEYNVYVAALVPGAALGSATPIFYVKPKTPGNWSPMQFPIAAFLEGVVQNSADSVVLIEILTDTDISSLVGTEFYVGYGLSDQEMLAAGRYRGVFKAQ